mmetsp:Transcript_40547/g.65758  ORF Transcript_40547/g.65758 Transcript_40547/m.65758 type:complete len:743 (+) Transcript_40547:72-2300(+)
MLEEFIQSSTIDIRIPDSTGTEPGERDFIVQGELLRCILNVRRKAGENARWRDYFNSLLLDVRIIDSSWVRGPSASVFSGDDTSSCEIGVVTSSLPVLSSSQSSAASLHALSIPPPRIVSSEADCFCYELQVFVPIIQREQIGRSVYLTVLLSAGGADGRSRDQSLSSAVRDMYLSSLRLPPPARRYCRKLVQLVQPLQVQIERQVTAERQYIMVSLSNTGPAVLRKSQPNSASAPSVMSVRVLDLSLHLANTVALSAASTASSRPPSPSLSPPSAARVYDLSRSFHVASEGGDLPLDVHPGDVHTIVMCITSLPKSHPSSDSSTPQTDTLSLLPPSAILQTPLSVAFTVRWTTPVQGKEKENSSGVPIQASDADADAEVRNVCTRQQIISQHYIRWQRPAPALSMAVAFEGTIAVAGSMFQTSLTVTNLSNATADLVLAIEASLPVVAMSLPPPAAPITATSLSVPSPVARDSTSSPALSADKGSTHSTTPTPAHGPTGMELRSASTPPPPSVPTTLPPSAPPSSKPSAHRRGASMAGTSDLTAKGHMAGALAADLPRAISAGLPSTTSTARALDVPRLRRSPSSLSRLAPVIAAASTGNLRALLASDLTDVSPRNSANRPGSPTVLFRRPSAPSLLAAATTIADGGKPSMPLAGEVGDGKKQEDASILYTPLDISESKVVPLQKEIYVGSVRSLESRPLKIHMIAMKAGISSFQVTLRDRITNKEFRMSSPYSVCVVHSA